MPLIELTLSGELSKRLNSEDSNFIGFSQDPTAYATRISDSLEIYASSIIPASNSLAAARGACYATLLGVSAPSSGITLLPIAVASFCAALAPGMVSSGFTGVPPTGLFDYQSLLNRPYPADYTPQENFERMRILANKIHVYFITGTAININTGATINWN